MTTNWGIISSLVFGLVCLMIFTLPASANGPNFILNSGFESSVTHWILLDGWMNSAIYDCPFLSEKPDLFKDGLAGASQVAAALHQAQIHWQPRR